MDDSRLSSFDNPDDPEMDEVKSENGEVADVENMVNKSDCEEGPIEPKKRKRGRKAKAHPINSDSSLDEDYVPERRSRRLQTKNHQQIQERNRLIDLGLIRGERYWKEFEKKTFLTACKEFGTKEVKKIVEKVPTKPPDKVKSLIQREKRNQNYTIESQFIENDGEAVVLDDGENGRRRQRSRLDLPDATPQGQIVEILKRRERNAPIEMWIDNIEKRHSAEEKKLKEAGFEQAGNYSTIVPTLLNWIADMEPHPDPTECGGVDYASIYRYFALLCEGEAPPDLNRATSLRVSRLLPMLVQILGQMDLGKETQYLENYRGPFTKYTWEEGFDPNSKECKNIIELGRIPGMNPLNLHPEMFTKKEIPKLDELIKMFSEEIVEEGLSESEDDTAGPGPQVGVVPKILGM